MPFARNAVSQRAMINPNDDRRRLGLRSFPFLRAARSLLTAMRLLPIFTPRQSLERWRSQRAMRAAARAAKKPVDRDWTKHFRLNGLTWHHFYISQDLRRIAAFLRQIHTALPEQPDAAASLVPLERSYAYLIDNVWDVYNSLERDVLFPWVLGGVKHDPAVAKALQLFGKERLRIEDSADIIQSRLSRFVCSAGYPHASLGPCTAPRKLNASRARRMKRRREAADRKARAAALTGDDKDKDTRSKKASLFIREGYQPPEDELVVAKTPLRVNHDELRAISVELGNIIKDTERLHKTERTLLYPMIAKTFPENEQNRLTHVLVYSMRSALAKFIITVYHQAVVKSGSRAQWKWYKREVPLPIRVYTPVWRARLYDDCPLGWLRSTPLREVTNGNGSSL